MNQTYSPIKIFITMLYFYILKLIIYSENLDTYLYYFNSILLAAFTELQCGLLQVFSAMTTEAPKAFAIRISRRKTRNTRIDLLGPVSNECT